jgi:hypothetical protein
VLPTVVVAALTASMVTTGVLGTALDGRLLFPDPSDDVIVRGATLAWAVVLGVLSAVLMYGFLRTYKYVHGHRACLGGVCVCVSVCACVYVCVCLGVHAWTVCVCVCDCE